MSGIGKFLILLGILLVLTGAFFIIFSRLKLPFLGRLPGDIVIHKKNFVFYFPITTSIIISVILSLIIYIFFKK
ncbi:MAG: DUF2905 domain-containing protein [Candidatus Omnitrophota bacterium]|nr:MAG: DUF2905 domain-containing protein [Candidatus Omnitrophota bacterium]